MAFKVDKTAVTNDVSARADQANPNPTDATTTLDTSVAPNLFPPFIVARRLIVSRTAINAIILTFSAPIDPIQVDNPINYSLLGPSRNRSSGPAVPFTIVSNAKAMTVTLTPLTPLMLGKVYKLTLNGQNSAGLTDLSGNLILGNTASGPEGPYVYIVSRGVVFPPPPPPHRTKAVVAPPVHLVHLVAVKHPGR